MHYMLLYILLCCCFIEVFGKILLNKLGTLVHLLYSKWPQTTLLDALNTDKKVSELLRFTKFANFTLQSFYCMVALKVQQF